MKRTPLFICEHGKRDDEDCLHCEIGWEERMIAVGEDQLSKSKAKLAALLAPTLSELDSQVQPQTVTEQTNPQNTKDTQ